MPRRRRWCLTAQRQLRLSLGSGTAGGMSGRLSLRAASISAHRVKLRLSRGQEKWLDTKRKFLEHNSLKKKYV
jgi:hypothetical protein